MQYPKTSTIVHKDNYFGQTIVDEYQWLEDDEAPQTKAWIKAQNEFTQEFLAKIPFQRQIKDRLSRLWNYEKFSLPYKRGNSTYYYKNNGLQNHYVLYKSIEGGEDEVFLDPNQFSESGTIALSSLHFTKDGSYAGYLTSDGGADWKTVHIIDTQEPSNVLETLSNIKFSGISWWENNGFFYSTYELPLDGSTLSGKTAQHLLYYHQLGTPQAEDKLIYGHQNEPRRYIHGLVSENEKWLIIEGAQTTTGNELLIKSLKEEDAPIIPLIENFDHNHSVEFVDDDYFYIYSTLEAPNGKLVRMPIDRFGMEAWEEIIPEKPEPLSVSKGAGYFFANYLKDALAKVDQYDVTGKFIRKVDLPGPGTAYGFRAKMDQHDLYFGFTNYLESASMYKYDAKTGNSELFRKSGANWDPKAYTSYQTFFHSKDGTKVPMMVTHRKDLKKDGQNPVLFYGYGGFSISLSPFFSISNLVWLEQGGVLAVPNLRGGGEYGESWHQAGTKMNKQNVFDDFIAAIEYLITEKITNPSKVAISGGSNGGLLVGAVMTQRPDLMKVAIPSVGVLDMLKYHKFTSGAGWAYDYGTAEDSREMFTYLLGYSPYHNLQQGKAYPATLVMTGDHDDRVVPAHSFKFAAKLQAVQAGDLPALIRIETDAGHGAGTPTDKIIQGQADKWAFVFYNLGKNYQFPRTE